MNESSVSAVDTAEIQRALGILVEPGQTFEVRILEARRQGSQHPCTICGYFESAAHVPGALAGLRLVGAKGFYVTLNPIDPTLLARSQNRLVVARRGETTADSNILRRRWLLVDCDPVRPAGVSSTDAEKACAKSRAIAIRDALRSVGWPDPVLGDSGNGYHLLYRLDLPVESDLVKRCLDALALRFSDAAVSVDRTVFNPSRIVKLYGTRTEKGDHCPDLGRLHRMSKVEVVPDMIDPVPVALLETLAGPAADKEEVPASPRHRIAWGSRAPWDQDRMQGFIDMHLGGCRPGPALPYDGGWKWVLDVCPFNAEHANGSAVVVLRANGALGFRCLHDSCGQHHWKDLREKFEPSASRKGRRDPQPTAEAAPEDRDLVLRHGDPIHLNSEGYPIDLNQMFFAALFKRDNLILYEPELGMFYAYDPPTGLWRQKTEERVIVEVGESLIPPLIALGAESLLRKRSGNLLGQIVRLLRGMTEKPDAFRHERFVVHVGNGVLHLDGDTPRLAEFSPEYYSRNRSVVCYDAEATCPRFLNELIRPAMSTDDVSLLQRYAGQCLLGCNPTHRLLLVRGTPGGGKSTAVDVIERIIGTHNVGQLRVQHLDDRFEIAGFVGKTLLTGKDVPGDFLNCRGASTIKCLTGGDRLSAEQKNVKHRFEVIGDFNMIITSNSRLHVRLDGDGGAWQRRLLVLDYEQPPTAKPIPYFSEKLVEAEGPGILNWCIRGAMQLLAELQADGFVISEAQRKRVTALLNESDSVRYFVTECVAKATHSDVTVSELLTTYNDFCDEQGWEAVTARQFEKQVGDVVMEIHRAPRRNDIKRDGKNQRGFSRLCLATVSRLL